MAHPLTSRYVRAALIGITTLYGPLCFIVAEFDEQWDWESIPSFLIAPFLPVFFLADSAGLPIDNGSDEVVFGVGLGVILLLLTGLTLLGSHDRRWQWVAFVGGLLIGSVAAWYFLELSRMP